MNLHSSKVKLGRVTLADTELLRTFRNYYVGKGVFQLDKIITSLEQDKWFASLDQKIHHYFMVEDLSLKEKVGYTNLTLAPANLKTAEVGVILKNPTSNPLVSFHSKMLTLIYGFEILQLDEIKAIFNSNNKAAIRFNEAFGFVGAETLANGFLVNRLARDDFIFLKESLLKKFRM